MGRLLRTAGLVGGFALFLQMAWPGNLGAFFISETRTFQEGLYTFKMEVQVYGRGNMKKNPIRITSLKVKIKNEKASSQILRVKAIRAYSEPQMHSDIETRGYTISPAQWVTKFYRLPKTHQPLLSNEGFFQIDFENFAIRFNPRNRQFLGPGK